MTVVCRELAELVTDYLENAVTPEEQRRLDGHLDACADCRAYVESMRVTIRSLGELPPEPADPDVRERLLSAFRELRG